MADSTGDFIAGLIVDVAPTVKAELEEYSRETVQTGIWVVGLAVGLLGLIALHPALLAPLLQWTRVAVVIALGLVVVLVLAQRVLHQVMAMKLGAHVLALTGTLAGRRAGKNVKVPTPPGDWCTRSWVVEKLREDFGLDYSFLEEYGVADERCRAIYDETYTAWKAADESDAESVKELIATFLDTKTAVIGAARSNDLIRKDARLIRHLVNVSLWIFGIAVTVFVMAVLTIAIGIAASF